MKRPSIIITLCLLPFALSLVSCSEKDDEGEYYKHVGIYAFRSATLAEVCVLPQSMLENSEKLEQLRWLEAGYTIAVAETECANIGIDTPEDLVLAEKELKINE